MALARLWTGLAVALSPALTWAEVTSSGSARPAESAFSWFTVFAALVVVAVLFGLFSDTRRSRHVTPR